MKSYPIIFDATSVRAILDDEKTQTRRIVKHPGRNKLHAANDGDVVLTSAPVWLKDIRCPYGEPGDRLYGRETWQYYDWTGDGEPCIRYRADDGTHWPKIGWDDTGKRTPDEVYADLLDVWAELSTNENLARRIVAMATGGNDDERASDKRWRPSIYMPHWASRITLEVVSVRVERVQDISTDDAIAEGMRCDTVDFPTLAFSKRWDEIHGAGAWERNDWVWVVTFRLIERES